MKKALLFILLITLIMSSGCAFVSIPLFRQTQPLQEKIVQGKGRNKILLIDISGIISSADKRSTTGFVTEQDITSRIKEELEKAARDKKIKGVILRINSPGGTVTASDIIYREIVRFKKKKNIPVVACLMDIATSGGYYIACAADEIIAHPTTVTGSIGVIAFKFNLKGLMDKLGIEEDSVMAGDKKDIYSMFRPMSGEEKKIMQDIMDTLHNRFISVIDESRADLTRDNILPLADGRVYTADQARDLKLIDHVGYLDESINAVQKQAGLAKAKVVMYHRPAAYKNNIYSQANISLVNFGGSGLFEYLPVRFMYMWNP